MRGVIIFLTALFVLAPYYLIMTMAFEPLIRIITNFGVDLSAVSGASTIETIEDIMFIFGPFVYVAGWFVWAVRYYYSESLRVRQRPGGRV